MGFIRDIYQETLLSPLMTDKYHFTTGAAYHEEGRADNPSVSYLFGRKEAQNGGYTVAAGLEGLIDILQYWQDNGLSEDDLDFLREQGLKEDYIDYLRTAEWKLKVDAVPEGTLVFPQEPLVRFEGPVAQAKVIESVALCIMNGQSAYATHGARMTYVLQREVESGAPKGIASIQGLRRGPAFGAALESSRGLAIGGYQSTSTGPAAKLLGQVFAGTMDHAWVQTHDHQLGTVTMAELFKMEEEGRTEELQAALSKDAFRSYAFLYPDAGILLTDTYDTIQGIEDAITVIKELRALGRGANYGMRFDSGDLLEFSKIALRRLAERDEDGDLLDALPEGVDISTLSHRDLLAIAEKSSHPPFCADSDGVDEYTAQDLRERGAYVKFMGIGTAGSHVPPVGLVQKIAAMFMRPLNGKPIPEGEEMTPTMKIISSSPAKSSNPGVINSCRFYKEDGTLSHVVIYDENIGLDPDNQVVDLKDFSNQFTNPGGTSSGGILVPVFDKDGTYVYNEPPKIPAYKGSKKRVTDLAHIARGVAEQIARLPEAVRRVTRPKSEVIKARLKEQFDRAVNGGLTTYEVNIEAISSNIPPEAEHIPVYLDKKLYEQRVACEKRHHIDPASVAKPGEFVERFNGPN